MTKHSKPPDFTARWDTFNANSDIWLDRYWCRCVVKGGPTSREEVSAYRDCPNCLGYGVMPIGLGELK